MSDRPLPAAEPEDRLGMPDEQWEWFQSYTHGFGEQDENGVDVSLLRENLQLTPSQRVERMLRTLTPDLRVLAEERAALAARLDGIRRH